ncbi:hypothetical protein G9A89_023149 [Geosiphon pyriformis]|nr:hypothetical protein G9A89_023149 [Geosiphon pyriformis]
MNNPAKQADVIRWHKEIDNMISIITETKLKGRICSWIADRFPGVCVFISSLDSGYLGSGVAIVMNTALVKHVCKISEVPDWLLSVRLLFKNKLLVSVLGLYAGTSPLTHFSQASNVNILISKAVNESFFVILGGNFNENGSHKSASFKKCGSLGLVNSLVGNNFLRALIWSNSRGVAKTIDYIFVFSNLVNAIVDCSILDVGKFFNTDHQSISVSVSLGGLLNTYLCSLRKQTNKNHWKEVMVVNAAMFSDDFVTANELSDLDAISSRLHKLELLVSKLVRASYLVNNDNFVSLLNTWESLDSDNVVVIRSLFLFGLSFNNICSALSKVRKSYHASKLSAIEKRMESFVFNKSHIIKSVLERPFYKMVLDHLIIGDELILEPDSVKSKMDEIMEGWTRKCSMPLDHVFDSAFSNVMSCVGFDELFGVVSNLPDSKAAGLLGISNELWKHCDISVLGMFLVLINSCLSDESFDVLHGDNFLVLKGTMTQSPIFAIELWLILQDMRKAYDLVGWDHLKKSLIRIKMYSKFIWFFGGIHDSRTNQVMTDFGLTDGYCVHDGLDQKEFSYLVSVVLHSIVSYRIQFSFVSLSVCSKWNALIRKGLKFKAGLSQDFLNDAFHHPSLYGLKTFKQIQAKCKPSAFQFCNGTPMSLVLASSVQNPLSGDANASSVLNSVKFGLVRDYLSGLSAGCISVYTDSSLSGLGSVNMRSGVVVFFDDINMGMGVKVSDLMSSTLVELQAIALVLKCVPVFSSRLKITWHKVKGHSGNFGNDHANELAGHAASSNLILPPRFNERYILAGGNIVSGNSKHFVCDVFCSIHHLRWKYGSDTNVITQDLLADIDWQRSVSVWHPDLHMAAGPTGKHTAGIRTYFMKALHHRLSVAVHKCLYDRGYPSVICLFCGCVEVSDHVFFCNTDAATRVHLLGNYAMIWKNISSLCCSTSSVLQFLFSCVLNTSLRIALCKGFVFKKWFHEAVSVFGDSKSASVKVVNFVHVLCLVFKDEIWSVCVKYCVFMEKRNLISRDSFLPNSKSGLSFVYSAGIIKLLGIDVALGVNFGFHKFSLFISDAFDMVFVSISA